MWFHGFALRNEMFRHMSTRMQRSTLRSCLVLAVLLLQEANAHVLPTTDQNLTVPEWGYPFWRAPHPGVSLGMSRMDNYMHCSNRYCAYVVNMCYKGIAAMIQSKTGQNSDLSNHVVVIRPGGIVKVMDSDYPQFSLKAFSYQDSAKHIWPTFDMPGWKIHMPFAFRRSKEYRLLFWRFRLYNGFPNEIELKCEYPY